jgi:hypothetical protein
MNTKTSEAPKDVPAVNYPSLGDGFYEGENLLAKRAFAWPCFFCRPSFNE